MRIIFVRHGDPDYQHDCLTELGHKQAKAVSRRLEREGISAVYASPYGRAQQTASYTAELLNLPINTLEFMHEITWGGEGIPANGHPWTLSDRMLVEENYDYYAEDWRKHPYFHHNTAVECYDMIAESFDKFLLSLGYEHQGRRFLCHQSNKDTIAVFSHGGSGACAISHLLALPFPYVTSVMPYDFTSVIILEFPAREGEYVYPRLALFNDISHLNDAISSPRFQEFLDDRTK